MPRTYIEVLSDLSGGEIAGDLTEHLARVADAVAKTGKAGSVAVTLKLTQNGENSVHVAAAIKSSVPDPVRRQNIMFVDDEGSLTTNDPLQATFDLGEVSRRSSTSPKLVR